MQNQKIPLFTTLLAVPFLITACLSSDDSSTGGDTGQMSLAVTDAPVDDAERVLVRFTSVELRPVEGEPVVYEFDDVRTIDLLAQQGSDHEWLFEDHEVPAGEYEQIRLHLEPGGLSDGPPASVLGTTSTIEFPDRTPSPLAVPSGLQTGLKLVSGFVVPADGEASLTVDFDLRKAITRPKGEPWVANDYYFLRPALRLVDNTEVGHLEGEIDPDLVDANNDACTGGNAVYVFDDPEQDPRDIRDENGDPVTTALVKQTEESAAEGTETWAYRVGFLTAGTYRIAFTCDAEQDDPEEADDLNFQSEAAVTIEAGETTQQNL